MRPSARLAAAVDVLDDCLNRHRPASTALSDWGKAHRFAGSGDRSVIGTLVFDALRTKASSAWIMGAETPRAIVLGSLKASRGLDVEAIIALVPGDGHSLAALSDDERQRLAMVTTDGAPAWVTGNYPQWIAPSLTTVFGDRASEEGLALARRAPIDLRVNAIKATREQVLQSLAPIGVDATPFAPLGVRIAAPAGDARAPHVEAETSHGKGWFEVQDEGSQIAALLAGARPRMQVLDLCAGAGGKTLALAASMQNTGQIYAYDSDKIQLRPIFDRLTRAGVTNVNVIDAGRADELKSLGARFDVVLVDAPCTGSGTWRRRPDAKWRLKPANLAERQADQRAVLAVAASMLRPGGRLIYVTCSVLPEENSVQTAAFLDAHPNFKIEPYADLWRKYVGGEPPQSADGRDDSLLLSPARHGTDGFFIASLRRTD